MSRSLCFIVVLAALFASGCTSRTAMVTEGASVAVLPEEGVPSDWRSVARRDDQAQLDAISSRWSTALAQASKTDARALVQEGALLRAAAALPRAVPTPGLYRCRSVRIGRSGSAPAERALLRFKPFDCVVTAESDFLGFTKIGGTHRPGGYLWPDGDKRMVFLGGTAERDGEGASAYGGDVARNRFGILERIGEFRWRLALIGPGPAATLEVIDLVPAVAVAARTPL